MEGLCVGGGGGGLKTSLKARARSRRAVIKSERERVHGLWSRKAITGQSTA